MANPTRLDGIAAANDHQLVTLTIAQLRALVAPPAEAASRPQPASDQRGYQRSVDQYQQPLDDPRRYYDDRDRDRFRPRSRTPPYDRSRRRRSPPSSHYDIHEPRSQHPYFIPRSRSRSPPSTRFEHHDNRRGSMPRALPLARYADAAAGQPNPTAFGYQFERYTDHRRRSPHGYPRQGTPDPGRREVPGSPLRPGTRESPALRRLPAVDCYRPGLQAGGPPRLSNQEQQHQRRQTQQVIADSVPNINAQGAVEVMKATDHNSNNANTRIESQGNNATGAGNSKSGGRNRPHRRGVQTSDTDDERDESMGLMTVDSAVKIETLSAESTGNYREQNRADVVHRTEELRMQIKAGRREKKGGAEAHVQKQRRDANGDMANAQECEPVEISPPEYDPGYITTELLRGYNPRK